MRISVIIPAYNAEMHLARAIESVLSQTVPVAEIVVVDDGSSDGTPSVIRKYVPPVRHIRQDNAGVSAARNRGIREATEEWIAFLDSDDEWLPHKSECQTALLGVNPDLKWCSCNREEVRNGMAYTDPIPDELKETLTSRGVMPFFVGASKGLGIGTPSILVHRSVLDHVGDFDTSLRAGEDRDLWWRIAMAYPEIGYCQRVCYRIHADTPASLTKTAEHHDAQLANICDNMRRARVVGPRAAEEFYPYARKLALNYVRRAAGGQVTISPAVIEDAKRLFGVSAYERFLLAGLACLPASFARRLVSYLTF